MTNSKLKEVDLIRRIPLRKNMAVSWREFELMFLWFVRLTWSVWLHFVIIVLFFYNWGVNEYIEKLSNHS